LSSKNAQKGHSDVYADRPRQPRDTERKHPWRARYTEGPCSQRSANKPLRRRCIATNAHNTAFIFTHLLTVALAATCLSLIPLILCPLLGPPGSALHDARAPRHFQPPATGTHYQCVQRNGFVPPTSLELLTTLQGQAGTAKNAPKIYLQVALCLCKGGIPCSSQYWTTTAMLLLAEEANCCVMQAATKQNSAKADFAIEYRHACSRARVFPRGYMASSPAAAAGHQQHAACAATSSEDVKSGVNSTPNHAPHICHPFMHCGSPHQQQVHAPALQWTIKLLIGLTTVPHCA